MTPADPPRPVPADRTSTEPWETTHGVGPGAPPRRSGGPFGLAVLLGVVVLGAMVLESLTRPRGGEPTAPTPLPPLMVEGWANTGGLAGPSVEALRGQLVVVDFWATWCGPCVKSLPKLATLSEKYRGRGVQLLGLTTERSSDLPRIEATIDRVSGFDWPVGYGAAVVADQLGVSMLPTYVLFDRQGRSLWRGHSVDALDEAIAERL